jgi:SAM-dependent methyltransferase
MGSFLDPMIARSPAYQTIISRLQEGASLLDVGCFVGQDLRRLVFDGAPPENLYSVDIVSHWEVGYDLFRDTDKFSAKFMETDIMNPNDDLKVLTGKIDIISVTHVLHQ